MAKSFYGKHNLADATQFLAGLADFTPAKPLTQYRPDQVIRKANAFKRQLQSGQKVSNAAARGVHKKEKQFKTPAPGGVTGTPFAPVHYGKEATFKPDSMHTKRDAQRAVRYFTNTGRGHVKVRFKDQDGAWHELGKKGGYRRERIERLLATLPSLGAVIAHLIVEVYGDDSELEAVEVEMAGF